MLGQLLQRREYRRGVSKLRKDDETHRKERGAAIDRALNHVDDAVGVVAHLVAMRRIG
jgi:hypothetical protein